MDLSFPCVVCDYVQRVPSEIADQIRKALFRALWEELKDLDSGTPCFWAKFKHLKDQIKRGKD